MARRDEEIAWAAGLFEGEGCVTRVRDRLTPALVNTDEEVIRRFHEMIGIGILYGPYESAAKDGYTRRPFFRWVVSTYDALDVLQLLLPWLSQRRLDRAFELTGARFPVDFADTGEGAVST
jgi:hypothetical protein